MPTQFYTVPNQRVVKIHREVAKSDFLGINNETWKTASRDLRPTALLLYLYFASNADGYNKALSPAAIQLEIGMPRSTYHDQFKYLIEKGYLVKSGKNRYDFFEKSQNHTVPPVEYAQTEIAPSDDGFDFENDTDIGIPVPAKKRPVMPFDIEINKEQNPTDNDSNKYDEPTEDETWFKNFYWNGYEFDKIPREEETIKSTSTRPPINGEFVF